MQRNNIVPVLALLLLAGLLCACQKEVSAPAAETAAPTFTPVPTATPTPTPTATPEPTPEPTPTPRATIYLGEAEADALLLSQDEVVLLRARTSSAVAYASLPDSGDAEGSFSPDDDALYCPILKLGEETAADGTQFYRIRFGYDGSEAYMEARYLRQSDLMEGAVSGFALMQRPGCALFCTTKEDSELAAREDYHAVRLLAQTETRSYVVTQEGNCGYIATELLAPITREQLETYFSLGQIADSAETFSVETFVSELETLAGTAAPSTEELLVEQLTRQGLFFSPGYYNFLTKPLGNAELYPQMLYQDAVYNSLLFKLWNSAGNLVTCEGAETQWAYIADAAQVQRGDLLFFSDYASTDTAVVEGVAVVLRGQHSGYVTSCGVCLGDGQMLTVENGTVVIRQITDGDLAAFDCARRIHPAVTDRKAHIIETMIATIYDRLGTPYNNIVRTGDRSYDCSGIVSWTLRTMDFYRYNRERKSEMKETTAAGFSNTTKFYCGDLQIDLEYLSEELGTLSDIERLERGDFVFLRNADRHSVGHIMIYLGEGNVIHSTTIDDTYRGTLVAGFREELQQLYHCATRIVSVGPRQ